MSLPLMNMEYSFGSKQITIIDAMGNRFVEYSDEYGSIYKSLPSGNYHTTRQQRTREEIYIKEHHLSEVILSSTGDIHTQMPKDNPSEEQIQPEQSDKMFDFRGKVVDLENNPISGAVLVIRGSEEEGLSDELGSFSIPIYQTSIDVVVYKSVHSTTISSRVSDV